MNTLASVLNWGFYGKIPSAGDFVSRHIPHHNLKYIDDWFCEGMASLAIEQHAWLDVYLTAPVWNFVIFPKQWGDEFFYGALMPSVDSVGRYFPFITVLKGAPKDIDPVLVSHLPSLASELPTLLQGDVLPDDVCGFLAEHVRSEACATDILEALDLVQPDTGASYWWFSDQEVTSHTSIVHHGPPNPQLFKQLFFDFQSLLP